MHRLIASLALTFLFVPSGIAQGQPEAGCRVHFAVVQRLDFYTFKIRPDDRDWWGRWPEDAREWWVKDGDKKFGELCEAARIDADFIVAWERWSHRRNMLRRLLHRVSVTLYRVTNEPQQFVPVTSLAKERYPDGGAGKAAFESAFDAIHEEVKKAAAPYFHLLPNPFEVWWLQSY